MFEYAPIEIKKTTPLQGVVALGISSWRQTAKNKNEWRAIVDSAIFAHGTYGAYAKKKWKKRLGIYIINKLVFFDLNLLAVLKKYGEL